MPTDLVVPKLGESISEAIIAKWLKNVGEPIEADEPVVDLETDKVSVALPAPSAGVLSEQRFAVGATVKVTTRDGRRFKAVLFAVNDDGVIVKPATRLPVASEQIPFDRLDTIQREKGRLRIGRYVGTGAAIAGGVMLWLLLGFAGG